jgi:hypothetical protein
LSFCLFAEAQLFADIGLMDFVIKTLHMNMVVYRSYGINLIEDVCKQLSLFFSSTSGIINFYVSFRYSPDLISSTSGVLYFEVKR